MASSATAPGSSGWAPRANTEKMVSEALFHHPSESRTDKTTTASGDAAASSRQNAAAGQFDRGHIPRKERHPIRFLASGCCGPRYRLVGSVDDLEHVVAGAIEQLLEGELQGVGAGPSQPRAYDSQTQ